MPGLRRFFHSCFHKRPESKSPPHPEASTETDSSDATLVPFPPSSPPLPKTLPIRGQIRGSDKAQAPETNTPTMPKAVKKKAAAGGSAKTQKPYTEAQQAARYYNDTQNHGGIRKADAGTKAQLNKLFDELLPEEDKARNASEPVPEIGAEQCMAYLEKLDVNPASYELFVVLEIVRAESIGTITRSGFVDGWADVIASSTGSRVTPDWEGQRRLVRARIAQALTDPNYFKTIYDFAFQVGREPGQKAISMAVAVGFWEGLYVPDANPWRSEHIDFLGAWARYLKEKFGVVKAGEDGEEEVEYKRTVSKDLWTQTRLFAAKTMQDETLSFWSEEQAWPGLIDEFVLWCREKGIVPEPKNGESMEVE
ncbi:Cullin binding-domain-containing protein [Corynascus similis CBS 632.67]